MANFINNTFTKDMYLSCYEHTVEPINMEQYWDLTGLPPPLPPLIKVQPDRPKTKRNSRNDVLVDPTKLRRTTMA